MMDSTDEKILSIDIGGSHIKATVLNSSGHYLADYQREPTPNPPSPANIIALIKKIVAELPAFDKISAGFPGYVKDGVVKTAPKLGNDIWKDFPLGKSLETLLGKPALLLNDADLQALALTTGKGFEMVITLGTGFGSAMMHDGFLLPHLEMSRHPVTKSKTYNDYLGQEAFEKIGKKKWNKRMKRVLTILKTVFNYDHLFISGGNAKALDFKLDANMSVEDNKDGIKGGAIAWQQAHRASEEE